MATNSLSPRIRLVLAATLLLAVPGVTAQSSTNRSYRLAGVSETGAKRFTLAQIVAASGLHNGQQIDVAGLDAAALRLSKTGAFSKVGYSFSLTGPAMHIDFEVSESESFLPCLYDNFVWFTDPDLTAAVRREVPLFDGTLPQGGEMAAQVTAALEKFLLEHKIVGKVSATLSSGLSMKISAYNLRVTGITIPVNAIEVTGGPLTQEQLAGATSAMLGNDYSTHIAQTVGQIALPEVYQNEGYLQARFSEPQTTMKDPQRNDATQGVTLKYTVTPGPLYMWNGVSWTGNSVIAEAELTPLMGFKTGDIARRDKTEQGWKAIREGYGRLGYLGVRIDGTPEFDASHHLVHFHAEVMEGPQYYMGAFEVTGVTAELAARLKAAWKLRPGQAYDASYEKTFMTKDIASALRAGDLTRMQISFNRKIDFRTHVVDLEMQVR